MQTDTVSLVDVSDAMATFRVGDVDYTMRRLQVGDYAAVQEYMVSQRMQAVIDKLQGVPVADAVLSGALADIVCRPILFTEKLDDHNAETFLLARALLKDGKPVSLKWVQDVMPAVTRNVLSKALAWAIGVPAAMLEDAGDKDPLATTATGHTSDPVSDGTKTSEPSASPITCDPRRDGPDARAVPHAEADVRRLSEDGI